MKLYLDQSIWSNFAMFEIHPTDPARQQYGRVLQKVRACVAERKLVCPVAFPHVIETARWPDEQQRNVCQELFVELSTGVCIRFFVELGEMEDSQWSECRADRMFPGADQLKFLTEACSGSPEEALEVVLQHSDALKALATRHIASAIELFESARRLPSEPLRSVRGRRGFYEDLCARRLRDTNRKVQPGDPMDLIHAFQAVGADVAVLDRATAALVADSKLCPYRVVRGVDELEALLSAR